MDNIITSFRRESTAFAMETGKHHLSNNSIGAPSDAEYAKAAAVWFPELEIFALSGLSQIFSFFILKSYF